MYSIQRAAQDELAGVSESVKLVVGCAVLILFVVMMAGVIVTLRRMKRPTANRRAHLSFIILVAGWVIQAAVSALVKTLGGPPAINLLAVAVLPGFALW